MKKIIVAVASLALMLNAGVAVSSASAETDGHKKPAQHKTQTKSTHKTHAKSTHKKHTLHKSSHGKAGTLHGKSSSHAKKIGGMHTKSIKAKGTQMPKTGFGGASEQME
ncbi:hypothetical protein [Paenibacillus tuaregi]|uniref:hypothetical protein n=1 Tax=Paenibacillus tuaregi TaxID=1816681 RepID=UPI000838B220|nr:hypothetical protein [Paenibacillus tuaregi]